MDHARVGKMDVVDEKNGTKFMKHIELGRQIIEREAVVIATSQRMKHEDDYDHAVERGSYDLRTGLVTKCELEKRRAEGRRARLMERNILMRNFKVAFVMSYIYPKKHRVGDAYAAIDMDGNGTLDEDEFDEGLREVLGLRLNKLEIALIFEVCDRDGDYSVEKYEIDSMLHVCPKEMNVTFNDFQTSLSSLGFTIEEENCYQLWRRLDQDLDKKEAMQAQKLDKLQQKTMTSSEKKAIAENGGTIVDDQKRQEMAMTVSRIRFDDLHAKLEPVREEIVQFYILEDFSKQMQNEILDAQDSAQGRWNILDVPTKQLRKLRSLSEGNQMEVFRRLREIYEKDVLPYEEEQDLTSRPLTPSTKADAYQLFEDLMLNVAIETNDEGLPDRPKRKKVILTSTERAATSFAVNYVKAVMQAKLIRVRDIFREMDDDGSGSVDEDEFVEGMIKIGIKDVRPLEIRLLYQALDKDGDRSLTLHEMERALRGRTAYATVNRQEFFLAMEMLGVQHLLENAKDAARDSKSRTKVSWNRIGALFDQLTDGQTSRRRVLFEAVVLAIKQLRMNALARGDDDGSGMEGLAAKAAQAKARAEQRAKEYREKEKSMRAKDATTRMLKNNNNDAHFMFGSGDRGLLDTIKQTDGRDFIEHMPSWEHEIHGGGYHESPLEYSRMPTSPNGNSKSKGSPLAVNRKLVGTFNSLSKPAKEVVSMFGDERSRTQMIRMFLQFPEYLNKVPMSDWEALKIMTDSQKYQCLNRFAIRLKRFSVNAPPPTRARVSSMLMMAESVDERAQGKKTGEARDEIFESTDNISHLFASAELVAKLDGQKAGGDESEDPDPSLITKRPPKLSESFRVSPPLKAKHSSSWSPAKVKSTSFKEFNGVASWRLPPQISPRAQLGIVAKPQELNGIKSYIPDSVKEELRENKIIDRKSMDSAMQKCKQLVGHEHGIKGSKKTYSVLVLPGSDADKKRLRLASKRNKAVTNVERSSKF